VTASEDHRVEFDFELTFSNGGGMQGQGFRMDIESDDIGDEDLVAQFVSEHRLLLVEEMRVLRKRIIREPHKRASS
jgi:arylformamidase